MGAWLFGRSGTSGSKGRGARGRGPHGAATRPGDADDSGRAAPGGRDAQGLRATDDPGRAVPRREGAQALRVTDDAAQLGHREGRSLDALADCELGTLFSGAADAPSFEHGGPLGIRRCPVCRQWYHATAAHPDCPWCSDGS